MNRRELAELARWAVHTGRRLLVAELDADRQRCSECRRIIGAEPEYTAGCRRCMNRKHGRLKWQRERERVTA